MDFSQNIYPWMLRATSWTVWGSNTGGGEIFHIRPDRPLGLTQPPVQRVPSFLWVKRPGRGAEPLAHLQCRGLKLDTDIPLPNLRALVACYRGKLYIYLHPWRPIKDRKNSRLVITTINITFLNVCSGDLSVHESLHWEKTVNETKE